MLLLNECLLLLFISIWTQTGNVWVHIRMLFYVARLPKMLKIGGEEVV